MTVKRFRTKIVEINAHRWEGDEESLLSLINWTGGNFRAVNVSDRVGITAEVYDMLHQTWIGVQTGQWIVRGAKGEFYPCDDETFHWKYEEVVDGPVERPADDPERFAVDNSEKVGIEIDPFTVAQIEYKFFKEDWRDKR